MASGGHTLTLFLKDWTLGKSKKLDWHTSGCTDLSAPPFFLGFLFFLASVRTVAMRSSSSSISCASSGSMRAQREPYNTPQLSVSVHLQPWLKKIWRRETASALVWWKLWSQHPPPGKMQIFFLIFNYKKILWKKYVKKLLNFVEIGDKK